MPKCESCGVERIYLHRHHIVPRSRGGGDEASNIERLCPNCHEDRHGGRPFGRAEADTPEAKAARLAGYHRWIAENPEAVAARNRKISSNPATNAKKSATLLAFYADPANRAPLSAKRAEIWAGEAGEQRKASKRAKMLGAQRCGHDGCEKMVRHPDRPCPVHGNTVPSSDQSILAAKRSARHPTLGMRQCPVDGCRKMVKPPDRTCPVHG